MGAVAQARSATSGRRPAAPSANCTFYTVSAGNDVYFRAEAPAAALGGRVALIPEADVDKVLGNPNRGGPLPWSLVARDEHGAEHRLSSKTAWNRFTHARPRLVSVRAEFPAHEGVAVFARPDLFARATLASAMREQGIRVVMETDDNYLADPKHNIIMRRNVSAEDQGYHARAMASGDAAVFSTAALRDTYRSEFRARFGKQGMPDLHICRNCVPRADWPERAERTGPLRVGFMGSPSHVWDVELIYAAFQAAKQEGCETVMIGYNPADPDPGLPDTIETPDGPLTWRSERSLAFKRKWAAVIDRAIPWVAPGEYRRAALPLDIGLAPLRSDNFTLGKSDIKAVEYSITGAATVCANTPVFNSAGWKHNVNALMASSPREYAEQTVRLIRDAKLRYELVSAAQEYVANERNELTLQREWGEALQIG